MPNSLGFGNCSIGLLGISISPGTELGESESDPESLAHAAVTVSQAPSPSFSLTLSTEDTPLPPPAAPSCPSTSTVQVKVRLPCPVGQQRKEENRRRNCVLRPDISPLRHYGKHNYDRRIDSTDDNFQ
ncbi:hypothetical protein ElyMa_000306900 [Elysia marginata]|uniref:Uncharacterized protein n=1 Tax=Elysia marginata TaxID=1093978 RepID=A0AAV4F8S9_9GAST|nr:hypothetical protein ElyMa_000306900 [Elysia marginata]